MKISILSLLVFWVFSVPSGWKLDGFYASCLSSGIRFEHASGPDRHTGLYADKVNGHVETSLPWTSSGTVKVTLLEESDDNSAVLPGDLNSYQSTIQAAVGAN